MSGIKRLLFSALPALLLGGAAVQAAEFEVLDRFSVDGYSVLRGSADIPGGSFAVGGSTFAVKDGKVGIGTTAPVSKLQIVGDGSYGGPSFSTYWDTDGSNIGLQRFRGSVASPAALLSGDRIGAVIAGAAIAGAVTSNAASMEFSAEENLSATAAGARISFHTTANGSIGRVERMRVSNSGNVGIGTAGPGYKLVVNDSDTSHFGIAEFLGGAVSGSYRYSQLYFGQALVAGQSSNIGYMTHQTDTSLSGLYFTNYGEGEGTSGIFIKRGGNVGIGTTAPGQKLSVAGTIESTSGGIKFPDGTVQTSAVPSGAVMFFNLVSCPTGWSVLTASQGRYLVSLPAGGTLGGTDGAALGNLEDRPVGQHNHAVTDAGHSHTLTLYEWNINNGGSGGYLAYTRNSNANNGAQGATPGNQSATTGISINNTGSTANTNAPYLQLLCCQKN